jgi:hypothetical protein
MADKIFPEGVRIFPPRTGSPTYVKGSIVITPNALVAWLKANPQFLKDYKGEKQIAIDLMECREGKPYLSVNTYQGQTSNAQDDLPF